MADMPDDRASTSDDAILAVGGVLFVSAPAAGRSGVRLGPAAGWMVPRGIAQWERELSFVPRASMTPGLASSLRATLADAQVAPRRFPMVKKAVEASPLLALSGNLVEDVRAQGVRVHTVGVDRVSGDFYYFEEGGGRDPLRVQGNLVEMLSPSIGSSSTNAEIAAGLDGLLDRLLQSLSGGAVSELAVELADALPRLSRDGTGLLGTDLEAFEAQSSGFAARAARWEAAARRIPLALEDAARKGLRSAPVPLFGEAKQEETAALDVVVSGKPLKLPGLPLWTVKGQPREEAKPAPSPAPATPTPSPAPSRVSSPTPARPAPSPASPRVARSPIPARPSPTPAPSTASPRVSPSPLPARPSPTPAPSSRIVVIGPDAPVPLKPTPLRLTPIPPRPEPVAPAVTPVPVAAPAPAPVAASAPASASASAPVAASASASASVAAPASASASVAASAPASAPALASAPAEPAPPPDRESPPGSRTATTARPGRPAPAKNSPSMLVLALLALAALAYIAFERFIH
jgi:hypothetical protein